MAKRLFDVFASLLALIIFSPLLLVIALLILMDSSGGVFYSQIRIGKNETPFKLLKFRSMRSNSDRNGLLTVGNNDSRITAVGGFIRKYKLDEIPQLINILKGEMSIVGPRPEVEKYVSLYTAEQLKVLSVKPGLTDLASLAYINENEILAKAANPEETYINEVMPAKLALNKEYIEKASLGYDIQIILKTIFKIVK